MNIRQVFGGGGNPANDYIELQMRATGENHTGGHPVQVYNAVGLPPECSSPDRRPKRCRPNDDPDRGHRRLQARSV